MLQRNDGTSEVDILQNQFTSYLIRAIKNKKADYLKAKAKRWQHEIPVEDGDKAQDHHSDFDINQILPAIEQLENYKLQQALRSKNKRALYIFLARALEDRSFADIAAELGMNCAAVSESYYRTIRIVKKELGGDYK